MSPPRALCAFAHPIEGAALAGTGLRALELGVGKARAAAAVTAALMSDPAQLVVLFGVCGAYPSGHVARPPALAVGDLCVVADQVLADEGVLTEEGFADLGELELGEIGPFPADAARAREAAALLGGVPLVRGATVSTCSARDDLSRAVAARTGAQIETMEGAAVALACRARRVPLLEVRCVSNMTGDRARAGWDLETGAQRAAEAVLRLWGAGLFGE